MGFLPDQFSITTTLRSRAKEVCILTYLTPLDSRETTYVKISTKSTHVPPYFLSIYIVYFHSKDYLNHKPFFAYLHNMWLSQSMYRVTLSEV